MRKKVVESTKPTPREPEAKSDRVQLGAHPSYSSFQRNFSLHRDKSDDQILRLAMTYYRGKANPVVIRDFIKKLKNG
jgi:hypothetical protein